MKRSLAPVRGVVCLHGFTGSPDELSPLVDALRSARYIVDAPLLAGHGVDLAAMESATREDWLAGAHGSLASVAATTGAPVAVVGASMGAALAVDLAVTHPDLVQALVLIAPPLGLSLWQRARLQTRAWLMRQFPGRRDLAFARKRGGPDVSDPAAALLLSSTDVYPVRAVLELDLLLRESTRLLSEVHQPVLVAHGRLDRTVPRRDAREVAARLSRVTAVETAWLEQSAHLLAVDRQKAAFAQRVLEFLGRATAAGEG
ncbi:MAG: alpha/beta hydrolase [Vicinamibacterales bacterium]